MSEDKLLTKKEASEYLKIGRCTLEKIMQKGEISYIKPQRKIFFWKSDLITYLDSKRIEAKPK